jgi:hypothetical protein
MILALSSAKRRARGTRLVDAIRDDCDAAGARIAF